jgi:hypothetical protein
MLKDEIHSTDWGFDLGNVLSPAHKLTQVIFQLQDSNILFLSGAYQYNPVKIEDHIEK